MGRPCWVNVLTYCFFSTDEIVRKSSDEALNRGRSSELKTVENGGGVGERKMSGHKRSRSEGSTATTAITVVQQAREEAKETAPELNRREVSPPYVTRQRKGGSTIAQKITQPL